MFDKGLLMKYDMLQINRYLSLPTSFFLFLFSIKTIVRIFYFQNISIPNVFTFFSSVLFLLSSILLVLDFLRVQNFLIRKKIWIALFVTGFVLNIVFE